MMEGEKVASSDPETSSKRSPVCEECSVNPWKYKCPGCSIRTCSLPCIKSHKQRTSCTGKKFQTQVVPLSQFDDNVLISDYNFLEEAKRIAESARRTRYALLGNCHFKLPFKLKALKNAAARRKIGLLLLSSGMSKRAKNQSRYNPRSKSIVWMVEWQFHSTDVVLVDNCVQENMNLCSVIEKHLQPGPWSHQLRPFCEEQLHSLRFFIRKNAMDAKSPFLELDIKASLSQQLANTVIVEYPVIHVFLPSAKCNFEVVKVANSSFAQGSKLKESVNNDTPSPSPKGVTFREEEIEDDFNTDPQIIDLMKHSYPLCSDNVQVCNDASSSLKDLHAKTDENYCISDSNEVGIGGGIDFDFEQDLRDAYSGLIEEVDPDSFLDFEGIFINGGDIMMDEELEEGEIRGP